MQRNARREKHRSLPLRNPIILWQESTNPSSYLTNTTNAMHMKIRVCPLHRECQSISCCPCSMLIVQSGVAADVVLIPSC